VKLISTEDARRVKLRKAIKVGMLKKHDDLS